MMKALIWLIIANQIPHEGYEINNIKHQYRTQNILQTNVLYMHSLWDMNHLMIFIRYRLDSMCRIIINLRIEKNSVNAVYHHMSALYLLYLLADTIIIHYNS